MKYTSKFTLIAFYLVWVNLKVEKSFTIINLNKLIKLNMLKCLS